jgi:hypothetical protein
MTTELDKLKTMLDQPENKGKRDAITSAIRKLEAEPLLAEQAAAAEAARAAKAAHDAYAAGVQADILAGKISATEGRQAIQASYDAARR